jgi:hypothetical protein
VLLTEQDAQTGQAFSYTLPVGAFTDTDTGDRLTLSVSDLPAWLSFDAASGIFSGTPPMDSTGSLSITVTATDLAGATARQSFDLVVTLPPSQYHVTYADGGTDDYYYSYAADGSLTKTELYIPAGGGGMTTTVNTFNSAGQLMGVATTHADGSTSDERYSYNTDGTYVVTQVNTPAGGSAVTVVMTREANGTITENDVTYANGTTDNYSYSYPADGGLIRTERYTPVGGGTITTVNTFNSAGQLTGLHMTNADGSTSDESYSYNADGTYVVRQVNTPVGGSAVTVVMTRKANGRITENDVTYANGATDNYSYVYSADGSMTRTELYTPVDGGGITTSVTRYESSGNLLSENTYTGVTSAPVQPAGKIPLTRDMATETVTENNADIASADVVRFGNDIASDQLWFSRVGNDLEVDVIGTQTQLDIKDWFLGSQHHVREFDAGDGKVLLESQVQKLVEAMASYVPPGAGVTTLPSNVETALAPILAANWK